MRIYSNTAEAYKEILRDIVKMGRTLKSNTVQNLKDVGDEYIMKELQLYSFMVADDSDIMETCKDPEWIKKEFQERVSMDIINPGEAWKLRSDYWQQFMTNGKLCYTYGARMARATIAVEDLLTKNPNTRQGCIVLWRDNDHYVTNGKKRVPCSMYYNIQIRDGKVDIIYHMRSSDFFEHFRNDFTLACLLKRYMADRLGLPAGNSFMSVDSLHAYKKDWGTLGIH